MFINGFDDRIRLAVLCDYALTSEDGKVSAIGMFSTINFVELPANYPRFFVIIVATLAAGHHSAGLRLLGPSGAELVPDGPEMGLEVPTASADTNLIIGFDNLGFESAGLHQLQLHIDEQIAMTLPFAVSVSTPTEGMTPRGNA